MDKKLAVLTAVFMLTAGLAFAQEMKADEDAVAPAVEEAVAPAAVEVGNKMCPITGEEIKADDMAQVEYEGKIYNVCKAGKEMFDKNPEQYADKFAALEVPADEMAEEPVAAPAAAETE
ncbi:MAG: hypothetical protein HY591_00530 [Candidatus Omnitrophica bacterium]|nr:hypothetical protein [Candidatus Omnitrophota bacterium]